MQLLDFSADSGFALLCAAMALPLASAVLGYSLGSRMPRAVALLATVATGISAAIGAFLFLQALHHSSGSGEVFRWFSLEHGQGFAWLHRDVPADSANFVFGLLYDGLGAAMFAVVSTISFLVHLYSLGYMQDDRRKHVFFANIGLFTAAMLGLVLADNLLSLFVCWEIMGFCSYLLIGHYSHDPTSPRRVLAARASTKAFLTARVGDVCLLTGLAFLYSHFGTLQFSELWRVVGEEIGRNGGSFPEWLTWTGALIVAGVVGKSAQFPLHVWLPDAMEGPTPVSAMIHAATMVAAGVFLLGRTYPLMAPEVLDVTAAIGAFTALFAASVGCTQVGIKTILAWSTISQLGFMVAAVGLGGVVAGMFHMVTHAFFKACLFLCAGSVIRGCHHEHDVRRLGGLRRKLPVTFACMLLATLAIAGVPLFAGFYSKDAILQIAFERAAFDQAGAGMFAAVALPFAAVLTAFYMFRLLFLTFFGEYRGHAEPHESPPSMLVPLVVLAALSTIGGHLWVATPRDLFAHDVQPWFRELVSLTSLYGTPPWGVIHAVHPDQSRAIHSLALTVSLVAVSLGFVVAWFLYGRANGVQAVHANQRSALYQAAEHGYFIDELVALVVVRPVLTLARWSTRVDDSVVDGAVRATGWSGRLGGFLAATFDRVVVDGAVNASAAATSTIGSLVRLLQSGRIQQYATFAMIGGIAAAAWLILS